MVDYMRRQSREQGAYLIDLKQRILDYNVKTPESHQDLSWLTQESQNYIAEKERAFYNLPEQKRKRRIEANLVAQ